MRKINLIDSKDSPRRLTRLVAVGLVVGAALLQAAPERTASGHLRHRRRPFRRPSMQQSAMTRRPSSSFSDLRARTLSNPAIRQDKDLRTEFARSAHEKLQIDADPLTPDRVDLYGGDSGVAVSGSSDSQERQMATRFGQRAARDSRTQDWQERIECHGGLPRLRRSANGIRRRRARRRSRPEICAEIAATPGKQDGLYLGCFR
jgi:hypothetical protein